MTNEKILSLSLKRQDQLLAFRRDCEGIRWRFTSAFGIGAVASLFISQNRQEPETIFIALIALFGLSICSILCQLRIYGVIIALWRTMIILQALEINELKASGEFSGVSYEQERAFYFPQPLPSRIRLLSVTGLSCSIFALLATLAIYSTLRLIFVNIIWSFGTSLIFLVIMLSFITWVLGKTAKLHYESKPQHVRTH